MSIDGSELEAGDELDRGFIVESADQSQEENDQAGRLLDQFDPTKHAYVQVSLLAKNDNLGAMPEEYLFSKDFGRIDDSQPWLKQDRVLFGRDTQPHNADHPPVLDINLRQNNRVSHRHCQLILKEGWKKPRRLTLDFLEFLKVASRKNNPWSQLPHELYRLIYAMFDFRPKFYIQDLGSKYGTFLRLTAKTELQEGMVFTPGYNSLFKVVKIRKNTHIDSITQIKEEWTGLGFKLLIQLPASGQFQSFAYMVVSLTDYKQKTEQNLVICCPTGYSTAVVVGRQPTNQIVLDHQEVSRKHCVIGFSDNKWTLEDGMSETQRSRNGTWLDVRTVDDIRLGAPSQPRRIVFGEEFKLGQTYLRFKIVNND